MLPSLRRAPGGAGLEAAAFPAGFTDDDAAAAAQFLASLPLPHAGAAPLESALAGVPGVDRPLAGAAFAPLPVESIVPHMDVGCAHGLSARVLGCVGGWVEPGISAVLTLRAVAVQLGGARGGRSLRAARAVQALGAGDSAQVTRQDVGVAAGAGPAAEGEPGWGPSVVAAVAPPARTLSGVLAEVDAALARAGVHG